MGRKQVWVGFGVAVLALAGCMTTGTVAPSRQQQEAGISPPPKQLESCGRFSLPGNELFEICGIGPEGAQAKAARHEIVTQVCGPIEATDEIKAFLCQQADEIFNAVNPYRADPVIAASFPDKTRGYYTKEKGNEIHYLAPNGKGYFWIANQRNVLVGEWTVYRNQQVCYHVPGMTEHPGTKWRCGPIRAPHLAEIAQGDALGLAKRGGGAAPWALQGQPRITIAEARQRIETMPARKDVQPQPPAAPAEPVPADPLGPMVMRQGNSEAL